MSTTTPRGRVEIATVADELAVRRVVAANEQAITDGDVDAYTGTFTPDAEVVFYDRVVRGREALGEYFRGMQGVEVLRDVVVGLVVTVTGDTATADGSGLIIRARQAPPQLLATAAVRNRLVKDADGTWLISWQEKAADPSFRLGLGTLTDVVDRLEARVARLERGGPVSAADRFVAAFGQALIAADAAPLAGLLAGDVRFSAARPTPGWAGDHTGPEAVARFVTEATGTTALDVVSRTAEGPITAFELVERIDRPDGPVALPLALVVETRDGLVTRAAFYTGPRPTP